MAVSGKYGKIDIPKIGADEPVFIIRAQDLLAMPVIEAYSHLAWAHHCPFEPELREQLDAFRNWSGPKKMPD